MKDKIRYFITCQCDFLWKHGLGFAYGEFGSGPYIPRYQWVQNILNWCDDDLYLESERKAE